MNTENNCPFTQEQVKWLKENLKVWTEETSDTNVFKVELHLAGEEISSDYIRVYTQTF